ncbi:phenylalanine--tRNA ligase subunit beta [Desulfovibrio sp. OttesenSCG-928-A18]|nr:phenylalanine--tRNA ligase subunit beta [Desulfovibrio sp. OttesenSCG-928-A18]
MLLSLNWLREFVPYGGTGEELGDKLTMAGLELDGLSRPYEALRPIVVGHVIACGRHPEADKLSVCRVDVGDEVLDIVCGAPNVAEGQKVAVVKVGVTLPNGLTVKKAKLRGAPSHGMICSEFELGLSEEHNGIMVLDPAAPVGVSLLEQLGLDDEVLDISVTPNRGDCLSVLGFAREVSALTGLPLGIPPLGRVGRVGRGSGQLDFGGIENFESGAPAAKSIELQVLDPELCPLYLARIIEGASTRRSPDWLRFRLQGVGLRSLSNLVDVTNYILMELGQPLHAFDLDQIRGGRVLVRGADPGERLVTLDGQERELLPSDITIRDAEGAICLGGVMGGLNSEITAQSTGVFLESAVFHPSHIRRTARRLSLNSEASYRFERGVDQSGAEFALNRAAVLMAGVSGASIRPGVLRDEARPFKAPLISLRKARAEALLGVPLDASFCETTLKALGCELRPGASAAASGAAAGALPGDSPSGPCDAEAAWDVKPPSWRSDLTREADLVEEVARVYGVDRIPAVLPAISRSLDRAAGGESLFDFLSRVKHWGRGAGLHEAVAYSFVSHRDLDQLGVAGGPDSGRISIMNPLSDELNVLRTHLAPGLLQTLRNNLAQGAASVRIFEVASVFLADATSETTAREIPHLGIILHGNRFERGWPQPEGDLDYLDLKGIVEHFAQAFALPEPVFSQSAMDASLPWLAPCVDIVCNGVRLGLAGRVKARLADPFHARKAVWLAEIDLAAARELHRGVRPRFCPLPVFPPVRRDITFITPISLQAGAISEAILALRVPILSSVRLIDCFEPENKAERKLTFRLTFRHAQRTLKDSEADRQRDHIAQSLETQLGIKV